jgi:hypothetical protein
MYAIDQQLLLSTRAAAKAYNVDSETLRHRRAGRPARQDCVANLKVLTKLEEKAIIEHALNVNSRGFQLNYSLLREIADSLLAQRSGRRVSVNWPAKFIKRVPELKLRVNQQYNYQRALNEDPKVIKGWFRLVQNIVAKHSISDNNIYNFDEAGFQMGKIGSCMVIIGSERR